MHIKKFGGSLALISQLLGPQEFRLKKIINGIIESKLFHAKIEYCFYIWIFLLKNLGNETFILIKWTLINDPFTKIRYCFYISIFIEDLNLVLQLLLSRLTIQIFIKF